MITESVQAAIDEISALYPNTPLHVEEDGDGGAFVVLANIDLGPQYDQDETWIGFHITHMCPFADTYPHLVRPDLSRKDGAALGVGLSVIEWPPLQGKLGEILGVKNAVQISRRSNRRDSEGLETPLFKLLKVLNWLNSR
jgi:hypothetical protein